MVGWNVSWGMICVLLLLLKSFQRGAMMIPDPAPVTMATFPSTESAIAAVAAAATVDLFP